MGLTFGSFDGFCAASALISCPLVGTSEGLVPDCYSRNVQIGNTLLFQPATSFLHIIAIIMTIIMILHIRSKYTAVGRKEIVLFFYLYAISELLAIFLDSAIIPTASGAYAWFAAIYEGLLTAIFWCLLLNGFVGFQFAEDGTPLSLWSLRLSTLALFGLQFFIAIATFKKIAGFDYANPTALWIIKFLFPLIATVVYIVSQVVLVLRTLEDRWPLGDVLFGTLFFAGGLVTLFALGNRICTGVQHYIDGTFFGSLFLLFAVMMVYKYWDSITKEDLEFSVGSKHQIWELKDPLLNNNKGYNTSPNNEYDDNALLIPGSAMPAYTNGAVGNQNHGSQYSQPVSYAAPGAQYVAGSGYAAHQQQGYAPPGAGYPPTQNYNDRY